MPCEGPCDEFPSESLLQMKLAVEAEEPYVIFSLTTIGPRIEHIKETLDALVEKQTRPPDKVFLLVPPEVKLPEWLLHYDDKSSRPGVLQTLTMPYDYGPSSKLLGALDNIPSHRWNDTLVIYGDDDMHYGANMVDTHIKAQQGHVKTAFGTRKINAAGISFLEATGTISVYASVVPREVFKVKDASIECRLSDDFFLGYHLSQAGVKAELIGKCKYSFSASKWPSDCDTYPLQIWKLNALSHVSADKAGMEKRSQERNFKSQLLRYKTCGKQLGLDTAVASGEQSL
eukprot:CAMPEP_0197626834 /NCGR_PEP_ID=MMETSP1338-20131121/5626_1 /TAXON_ID=43686 ORGANISM="Pelagodinium beii, Strain RCC1491" /NCGR_SAMPLE_ID=MMETSP1338 /ASSEMBLY_ACC=CAM_ASM_000754 /LENGTH=286 /DNA_ID=CAMNT_0043197403 /DNA_START=103 /DNA_END=963 /DNA_ORIENTATION=+